MVPLQENFGVAAGEEPIAKAFQFATQFGVVVDGAIEHHGQAEIGIDHRLAGSFRQVHDLQPSMSEGDRTLGVEAPGVGATRGQVVGDAFDRCEVGCLVVETKLS